MTHGDRTIRVAILAGAALVLAGCAASAASTSPAASAPRTSPSAATATPTRSDPPASDARPERTFFDRVPVSEDRAVMVRCVGHGSPTILVEGGGATPSLSEIPEDFVDALAAHTSVCYYSRAGGRFSDPDPGPRPMAAFAGDAFAMLGLLRSRGVAQPPYLIIGASLGGSVALAEALTRPKEIAGLVILDDDFPIDFLRVCRAGGRTADDCQREYDDDIDAKFMESQVAQQVRPMPDLPITIVTAMDLGPDCTVDCAKAAAAEADRQLAGWRALGAQVAQVRADGTHDLIATARDVVVSSALDVLDQARARYRP